MSQKKKSKTNSAPSSSRASKKKHSAIPHAARKAVELIKTDKVSAVAVVVAAVSHAPEAGTATVGQNAGECQKLIGDLSSYCSDTRTSAATELARHKQPQAVQALIIALTDLDADVARDAAASLGQLGDSAAVDALISALSNISFTHPVVRAAAAASLGQIGDLRAVDALISAITDPMTETSAEAIRALGQLDDGRAVLALIEVTRNHNGYYLPTARRAAVQSLVKLGGPQALAELHQIANNHDEDALIRHDAHVACSSDAGNA